MKFQAYRDYAIMILALAVPLWFLRASMRDPRQASSADWLVIQISAPIQNAAAMLARGVSRVWGDYVYLVDVKRNNDSLASQNGRLRERVAQLERLEVDNRNLKRLLDVKSAIADETVSAEVIGKNTNDYFRVLRVSLDRPRAGLGPNLPVITADGVVGITTGGAGDTLDVRLVVDAGAGVDSIVERTGARGYVKGSGNDREYSCNVEYMQRTDEVEVGDLLVTSGKGLRFPKGVPVCRITKITKRDFGIYQQVACAPTVDFSRLEEVLLVLGAPTEPAPATTGPPKPLTSPAP